MKKYALIILAVLLVFSFCGCAEKENNSSESNYSSAQSEFDLDAVLKEGEIPSIPYKLGTSTERIKKDANYDPNAEVHDHDEALTITETYTKVKLSYLTADYYYEQGKEDMGISSILVNFGEPFGLEIGNSTPDEVRSLFPNTEFEERELTSKQVYFVPMEMSGCTALTYKKDNRRIDFVFENDMLIAVNLIDTDNWSFD